MATPATRTPIKLARGSYSNLYASIDDIQEGEIVYAEDQNQLYVKEGSQLIDVTGDGGGGSGSTNLSYTTSGAGLSLESSSGSNVDLPAATTSAWGLMTDEDKTKLDGITGGTTNLTNTANGTSLTIESSTGNNTALPAATTSAWGVMTDEDKTNLDANTAKTTNATHTGEVTGSGALTIADNAVVTDRIADDAVTADKLANSINTEIAANTAKVTNATHTGDVTGSGALTIADDAVTYAKMQNVSATDRVLGRDSSGAGIVEEITPANLRTMINVEDGATADQSNAEIRAAVEAATDSNVFTDADHTKLNGIETSATADQTGAEIKTAYEAESDTNAFTDALKTKLDGIEASATADQTGAEIKSAYEGESDTNAYTDAEKTKLAGIAASANNYAISSDLVDEDNMSSNSATKVPSQQSVKAYVDTEVAGVVDSAPGALDTLNELAAALGDDANFSTTVTNSIAAKLPLGGGTMTGNIVMSGSETVDGRDLSVDGTKLDGIASSANNYTHPSVNHIPAGGSSGQVLKYSSSGTAAWGTDNDTTYTVGDGGLTQNNFTNTLKSKLDGIEASATADQTNAEIRAAVEAATDSNVFTDTDHSKLNGIEASADVTDATNVDAAGAVMNSDLDGKGELLVGDGSGDPTALAVGTNNYVLTADSGEATGVKWAATATGTPEGTAILSTGESGGTKFLREDGDGTCSWQTVSGGSSVTVDDTPVDGDTSDAISSNWAYDHNVGTGNGKHVPAAGSSGQFLKHDGTWGVPSAATCDLHSYETLSAGSDVVVSNEGTSTAAEFRFQIPRGDTGANGKTVLSGSGAPGSVSSQNGDFWIDTTNHRIYGPKNVTWPGSYTSLVGPTGATGATGAAGADATVDVGIADDKILQVDDADAADDDYAKFTANGIEGRSYAEVKTDLSLNNVENTAVSTWAGTSNITTLGTIGTGTWQGTAIGDTYISSASTWNAKQAALTFGIANTNAVKIDHASVADDDYAKFTSSGVEGRSAAEVKTDLSLNNVENTAVSTWAGSANITTLGTVSTITSTAHGTAGARKIYTSTSAPSGGANGDVWIKYTA